MVGSKSGQQRKKQLIGPLSIIFDVAVKSEHRHNECCRKLTEVYENVSFFLFEY